MAAPHLLRNNTRPVHLRGIDGALGNHLLVIRQPGDFTDLEMHCRPSDERFVQAAAWGNSSYYSTNLAARIAQDANAIADGLRARVNALSGSDWTAGHKAFCTYFARQGCPARCMWRPSDVTADMQQRYLEFGTTRHLLKYDLSFLPLGKFSSVRVCLRIANPSFVLWDGANCLGFDYAHNGSSDLCYRFMSSVQPPSALEQGNVGAVALCQVGNKGNVSNRGAVVGNGKLDVYGLATAAGSLYDRTNIRYYYDKTQWTVDHEVTDANVLSDLKAAAGAGRYVWLMYGGRICNGISSAAGTYGMAMGATSAAYATRVELVFKISGKKWNRT